MFLPAILESYFKSETLDKEVDLDQLASLTDGLSGSDLKSEQFHLLYLLALLTIFHFRPLRGCCYELCQRSDRGCLVEH